MAIWSWLGTCLVGSKTIIPVLVSESGGWDIQLFNIAGVSLNEARTFIRKLCPCHVVKANCICCKHSNSKIVTCAGYRSTIFVESAIYWGKCYHICILLINALESRPRSLILLKTKITFSSGLGG